MDHRRYAIVPAGRGVLFVVLLALAGCAGGVSGPCNDSDPVGPCATSHGQTHGG
jgi:hypothetical protein